MLLDNNSAGCSNVTSVGITKNIQTYGNSSLNSRCGSQVIRRKGTSIVFITQRNTNGCSRTINKLWYVVVVYLEVCHHCSRSNR